MPSLLGVILLATLPGPAILPGWPQVGPSGNTLVIRTSDPVASVKGGATLTVDGKPIGLADPLYTAQSGDDVIVYPLNPAPVIAVVDDADATKVGDGWKEWTRQWSYDAVLYGGKMRYTDTPTDTLVYPFAGLVPATYRVSVNPALNADGCATDLTFTCDDGAGTQVVFHQDQSAPTRFDRSDLGTRWLDLGTVKVSGETLKITLANAGGAGQTCADAIRLEQVIPDRAVPADAKSVTFSAPAGWATTTAGDLPAATDAPVALADDAGWFPFDPAAWKGMRVGYNLNSPTVSTSARVFANLLRSGSSPAGVDGGTVAYDAQGRPTAAGTGPSQSLALFTAPGTIDGRGINLLVPGTYTVRSRGPGVPGLVDVLGDGLFRAGAAVAGEPLPDGRNVFAIDVAMSPHLPLVPQRVALRFDAPATDLELLSPGTPADWDKLAHPAYHDRYEGRGYGAIRLLDALPINGSGVVEFADFDDPDQFGIMSTRREIDLTIASIDPADLNDDTFQSLFTPQYGLSVFKVTTTAPHGLVNDNLVRLFLENNNPPDASGGTTFTTSNWWMPVTIISPTQFYVETGSTTPGNILTTLSGSFAFGGGSAKAVWGGGTVGPRALVDVCNELGVNPWFLVPHAASDDCVTQLFAMIARELDPKLKCRVEYTNEHWNWGFAQSRYCVKMAHRSGDPALGGIGSKYYARRAGRVHGLARAAFAAAGRPETDVVRVMGSQAGNPTVTEQVVGQCQADGIAFDELAVDTYLANRPRLPDSYAGDADAAFDRLDPDGLIDVLGVNQRLTHYDAYIRPHLDALARRGYPGVKLVSYEGGYDYLCPFGAERRRNLAKAVATAAHPRIRLAHLSRLQLLDAAGFSLVCRYLDDGSNGVQQGTAWVDHPAPFMADGLGDGSDGKNDNRTNPWDYDRTVSVLGQAQREYAALAVRPPTPAPGPAPTPPPPPVPPPAPPTRYAVVTGSLGTVGVAQTVTVTPDGPATGTITLASKDGTFDRTRIDLAGAVGPVVVHFVPGRPGTLAIAATNDAGWVDPPPCEIEVVRHLGNGKAKGKNK